MNDYLNYFTSFTSVNNDIFSVCETLNKIKKNIDELNFTYFVDHKRIKDLFRSILDFAISTENEYLANSQYVFSEYFELFTHLAEYFNLLQCKEYRKSWDVLQDCFDIAKSIGQFLDFDNRLEVPQIIELLLQYERLYPHYIFASSEYVISKSHCSICGRSMQSLDCPHRKGNLYWGKMAIEVIDEIKTIQAVAIVSHPEDKRCILELQEDEDNERKYAKLDAFLELKLHPLTNFIIETTIETRKNDSIKVVGRNEPCSCGSGQKFKKCCGNRMYYKHERNIVKPREKVIFQYI